MKRSERVSRTTKAQLLQGQIAKERFNLRKCQKTSMGTCLQCLTMLIIALECADLEKYTSSSALLRNVYTGSFTKNND